MSHFVNSSVIFLIAVFAMLSLLPIPIVSATPPTPPAQLQLPKAEELTALQPQKGVFSVPARVRLHQEVSKLTLIVRTVKSGTLGRREGQVNDYALEPIKKGQTQSVTIKIPVQGYDGIYRIVAALQMEQNGQVGVVSKGVLIQVVHKGQPRLTTPAELRRTQLSEKKQAFREALAKKPKKPDIQLLLDSMTPVPAEQKQQIKPYAGPKHKKAHGSRIPAAVRPHIIDQTLDTKASGVAPLTKSQPAGVLPPISFTKSVKGQVFFEDFYSNQQCDPDDENDPYFPCDWLPPILTPLANATVVLYKDNSGGFDAGVGITVTDENGSWSIDVGSSIPGSNLYYTVSLVNESFTVRDDAGNEYVWRSATRFGGGGPLLNIVDFGQETMTGNVEAAQVFTIMNRGWNHIVFEGGADPNDLEQTNVHFPDFCIVDEDPTACWDSGDEIVRIEAGQNDSPDVILHEYGHALMFYAFGGFSIGGGAHSFNDIVQDPGVALSEGWATAFALSVCPDGTFTFNEDIFETPDEWPACAVDFDFSEGIEGFRFPTVSTNRVGEHHEGRIAAAINDFLDADDDDNGGTESRGKNGYEDANANNRISLATIYLDHMVGYYFSDFISFYAHLRSGIGDAAQPLTDEIMEYNWMSPPVTIPWPGILCVASKVAMAASPDYAAVLEGLRGFRDNGLKPLKDGRHWIQSYYSHSPEMAVLLIGNAEARQAGKTIVEHFSKIGHTLKQPEGGDRLSESQALFLPPDVIASIKKISKVVNAKGSQALKQKLAEAREFLKTFKGMSVSQAFNYTSTMKKAGRGKDMLAIQPMQFAPGSQHVDWELIKKNIPAQEIPVK